MFISQPAISLAIKELEKYYGVKLFERVSRKLFLTDAGQVVYTYAAKIFSLLDGLNQELKHPVSGGWGGGLDRRWHSPQRPRGAAAFGGPGGAFGPPGQPNEKAGARGVCPGPLPFRARSAPPPPPRGRWGELQPSREQGALPRARAQRRTRLLVFI